MNVYRVVSEELTGTYWTNGLEVPEPYCIAVIVATDSPSRARWLAWKSDSYSRSDTYDIRNMPKFKVELIQRNFPIAERVVDNGEWDEFWTDLPRPYTLPYVALVDDHIALERQYLFDEVW